MRFSNLMHFATYLVVRLLICVVQSLRIETCEALTRNLAWLFADVLRLRGRVVDENLRHAFPGMSPSARRVLARRMWEHLFLFVVEIAYAPRKIHETNWRDFVELTNVPQLVRLLLDERPLMIISAHFGNFELGGYVLGLLGFHTQSVARDLDNPYLHAFVNRFRGVTGQRIISKKGGYDEIVDALSSGKTMALLADQYAGRKGCWVEFFSRPASAYKAIALLALNHDARLAVAYCRRLGRPLKYEFIMQSELDPRDVADDPHAIRTVTQWYTTELERAIRGAPEQYWWVHRRWKDNRRPRRKTQTAKAA